ncbi:MAG: peptidoglycan-binding domain-containing protein, partial [Alphaproteobacteria bacterium]
MAILAGALWAAPPDLDGMARAASDPASDPASEAAGAAIAEPGGAVLVTALQTRLKQLGLYRGRVDGRLGLLLELAIRDVQRSLGLAVDGRASAELLARLEGVTEQATALRQRLDALRTSQARQARELLARAPATRDLLDGPSEPIVVPTLPCPETIDLACVVGSALAALPLVAEPDRRDWAVAQLARALTRAGDEATARRLVAVIEDPRSIITALRDMAIALAEAGRAGDATAAADIVPAPTTRLEARVGAANALLDLGRRTEAALLVGPVLAEIESIALGGPGVVLLATAATVIGATGDTAAAARLLD